MEWDGHLGLATARSRSLHRSASRPRSASPGRHTYHAGATAAPTIVSSLHAPTASSMARSRYADRAAASYRQRPLYGGTAAAVQGRYGNSTYPAGAPQVVGYQEVPIYEQLVHREVRVPYEVPVPVPYEVPYEVERLVEVPVPYEVPVYVGQYDGHEYDSYGYDHDGSYGQYGHHGQTTTASHANPSYGQYGFAHAVRETFARFDRNRSGRLDYRELRVALRALGIDVTTGEAADALAAYDVDGSGLMEMQEFETLVQQLGYRGGYGGYAANRALNAYGGAAARRLGSGVPWSPTGSSRTVGSPLRATSPLRSTSPLRVTSPRRYDYAPDEFYDGLRATIPLDGYARSAHWQALGTGTGARAVAVPLERCVSSYRPSPGVAALTPRRASSSGRARSAPRTRPLPTTVARHVTTTQGGSGGYGGYRPALLDSLSYC